MLPITLVIGLLLWVIVATTIPTTALSTTRRTVINPETKRPIKVQGPTFSALLREGGYVYHNDKLHPIIPGHYPEPILSQKWTRVEPAWSHDDDNDDDGASSNHDEQHSANLDDDNETPVHKLGLLFVNKPSGLLTVPGREQPDCLIQRIITEGLFPPQAKVCHRLDRDTSGVMVVALDADMHRQVSKLFETRQVTKIYTALVAGHLEQDAGTIDLPIGKAATAQGYNRWVIGGTAPRTATTTWHVQARLQRNDLAYTRVQLQPLTGRGQQIRLHMQAMGHALLGDTLHATSSRHDDIATATPRLCLHATQLAFTLDDGTRVEATVPPPF